jgi:hypothetical protein
MAAAEAALRDGDGAGFSAAIAGLSGLWQDTASALARVVAAPHA